MDRGVEPYEFWKIGYCYFLLLSKLKLMFVSVTELFWQIGSIFVRSVESHFDANSQAPSTHNSKQKVAP